jgi:hypothetical protein
MPRRALSDSSRVAGSTEFPVGSSMRKWQPLGKVRPDPRARGHRRQAEFGRSARDTRNETVLASPLLSDLPSWSCEQEG